MTLNAYYHKTLHAKTGFQYSSKILFLKPNTENPYYLCKKDNFMILLAILHK